jgi:hypothetical protein
MGAIPWVAFVVGSWCCLYSIRESVEGGTWESIIFLELYCDELLVLFDYLMNKNITFSFKKKKKKQIVPSIQCA